MTYTIDRIVPRETIAKLESYHALLLEWQTRINLIATPEQAWERHFLDSAQLFHLFRSRNDLCLDMGSGAGFPGLVLSIMGMPNIHIIDSDRKKILFMKEVARITGAAAIFHHGRVESTPLPPMDAITSRALADVSMLLSYATPHLKKDAYCLFPKGKNWSIEIEQARNYWSFDAETIPSQTNPESAILRIKNIQSLG